MFLPGSHDLLRPDVPYFRNSGQRRTRETKTSSTTVSHRDGVGFEGFTDNSRTHIYIKLQVINTVIECIRQTVLHCKDSPTSQERDYFYNTNWDLTQFNRTSFIVHTFCFDWIKRISKIYYFYFCRLNSTSFSTIGYFKMTTTKCSFYHYRKNGDTKVLINKHLRN